MSEPHQRGAMMTEIEKGQPIAREHSYRIMIVDGKHPDHVTEMKTALKDSGQEVVKVGSVSDAEDFLHSKDHVDLIVSEVFMENDDVFKLLSLVKKEPSHKDVPILTFACEPSRLGTEVIDSVSTAAKLLGASKTVHMPSFDLNQLIKEIRKLLAELPEPKRVQDGDGAY